MEKGRLKKRWLWFLVVTLLSSALFFAKPIVWHNGMSDTAIYSATIDFFRGDRANFDRYAQQTPGFGARPLWPLLAVPFSFFVSNYAALAIVNVLFSLVTVFLLYGLVSHLYEEKTGFLAGLLYATSLVPIAYSSRPLTEAGSYFFLVLLIYYIEVRVKKYGLKELVGLVVLLALALLHKESALFLLLYLAFDLGYRYKLGVAIKRGVGVLMVFFLSLLPVSWWKSVTNTSWFKIRGQQINRQTLTFAGIPALVFRSLITFHLGWLFAGYGFWQDKNKPRRAYYWKGFLALTPIVLYAWVFAPPFSPRFAHFLFPLVIPAFAFGLNEFCRKKKLSDRWLWGFVLLYYAVSYFGAFLFPSQDVNKDTNLVEVVWEELRKRF